MIRLIMLGEKAVFSQHDDKKDRMVLIKEENYYAQTT